MKSENSTSLREQCVNLSNQIGGFIKYLEKTA